MFAVLRCCLCVRSKGEKMPPALIITPSTPESDSNPFLCTTLDQLPYPEVFDLDSYFIPEHRISDTSATSTSLYPYSSSNRSTLTEMPDSTSESSTLTPSPRFAYHYKIPSFPSTSSSNSDNEIKKYRDHYRPPAYSRPPAFVIESTFFDRQQHRGCQCFIPSSSPYSYTYIHPSNRLGQVPRLYR